MQRLRLLPLQQSHSALKKGWNLPRTYPRSICKWDGLTLCPRVDVCASLQQISLTSRAKKSVKPRNISFKPRKFFRRGTRSQTSNPRVQMVAAALDSVEAGGSGSAPAQNGLPRQATNRVRSVDGADALFLSRASAKPLKRHYAANRTTCCASAASTATESACSCSCPDRRQPRSDGQRLGRPKI